MSLALEKQNKDPPHSILVTRKIFTLLFQSFKGLKKNKTLISPAKGKTSDSNKKLPTPPQTKKTQVFNFDPVFRC